MISTRSIPWATNSIIKLKRGRLKTNSVSDDMGTSPRNSLYVFQTVNRLSIETLQPARWKQRDLLLQMILKLSEEEFLSLSQVAVVGTDDLDNIPSGVGGIQPDEILGVYDI